MLQTIVINEKNMFYTSLSATVRLDKLDLLFCFTWRFVCGWEVVIHYSLLPNAMYAWQIYTVHAAAIKSGRVTAWKVIMTVDHEAAGLRGSGR